MIISRTPYRISFLGGGTDYPAWYREHGGAVLATTIDKYCYLTCRYLPPFFEHRYRVVYSKIESCHEVGEITHPAVREVLKLLGVMRGMEIHHDGDLPARSGMGSSSSFTVGLLHAVHALHGQMVSKHQLAMEGIRVEQEALRETVGSQDQVMVAYGGLNHVRFHTSGEITVEPVIVTSERRDELNSHLMLFYTGIKRTASEVASSYVNRIDECRRQMRIMSDLVQEGLDILGRGKDLCLFGDLLHEAWQVKRSLSDAVASSQIDAIYSHARSAGALGGKLLGAGGGGFVLFFAPPDRHDAVRAKLSQLIHVPVRTECAGSQVIFHEPEKDYLNEENARMNSPMQVFSELDELCRAA